LNGCIELYRKETVRASFPSISPSGKGVSCIRGIILPKPSTIICSFRTAFPIRRKLGKESLIMYYYTSPSLLPPYYRCADNCLPGRYSNPFTKVYRVASTPLALSGGRHCRIFQMDGKTAFTIVIWHIRHRAAPFL